DTGNILQRALAQPLPGHPLRDGRQVELLHLPEPTQLLACGVYRTVCARIMPSPNTKVSTPSSTRLAVESAAHSRNSTSPSKIWVFRSQVAFGTSASNAAKAARISSLPRATPAGVMNTESSV